MKELLEEKLVSLQERREELKEASEECQSKLEQFQRDIQAIAIEGIRIEGAIIIIDKLLRGDAEEEDSPNIILSEHTNSVEE